MEILNLLKEISPLFKCEYRRFGVTTNHPLPLDKDQVKNLITDISHYGGGKKLPRNFRQQIIGSALIRVPLKKDLSEWSDFYLFISPNGWCHDCQRFTFDELIENCKFCHQKLIRISYNKNIYIGFPNSKMHSHLNYLPAI